MPVKLMFWALRICNNMRWHVQTHTHSTQHTQHTNRCIMAHVDRKSLNILHMRIILNVRDIDIVVYDDKYMAHILAKTTHKPFSIKNDVYLLTMPHPALFTRPLILHEAWHGIHYVHITTNNVLDVLWWWCVLWEILFANLFCGWSNDSPKKYMPKPNQTMPMYKREAKQKYLQHTNIEFTANH